MNIKPGTILVVDDIPANIDLIVRSLEAEHYDIRVAESGFSALEQLSFEKPDLILLDVLMPDMDGFTTAGKIKAQPELKDIPIIFLTALDEEKDIVRGFEAGAVDYVTKPIRKNELLSRVRNNVERYKLSLLLKDRSTTLESLVTERTAELKKALDQISELKSKLSEENIFLRAELSKSSEPVDFIAADPATQQVLELCKTVAPTDATVLITGETGTGKEVFARFIHSASGRSNSPMVAINCAALPEELMESELFGHKKGAFTGAISDKIGKFEFVEDGTLFLDEIGELSLKLQAKLLRVLQEGTFEPLGSNKTKTTKARILAATNRDLLKQSEEGTFRQDLYFRLNVIPVEIPALRERPLDLEPLVNFFINKNRKKLGKPFSGLKKSSWPKLRRYTFPGNVRELENLIERACILSQSLDVEVQDWFFSGKNAQATAESGSGSFKTLQQAEIDHIKKALELSHWKVSGKGGAAELLDINDKTLQSRIKKLEISKNPEL